MKVFGLSDVGLVRSNNEDTYRYEVIKPDQAVFVVCDGMGGALAGNVASEMAADIFLHQINDNIKDNMSLRYMESIISNAISFANYDTYRKSLSSPEFRGMGTTLVGGIISKGQILLANIGDSRAYVYEENELHRITRDHSFVEELIRMGEITEEEARFHPRRNLITRSVGTERRVRADYYPLVLEENQKLLLCSDGLSGLVSDKEMCDILADRDVEQCCENLIEAAKKYGGNDNITALIITL